MAWRNLWRRKRRTAITLMSVSFGVWLAVTFIGIGEHSYSGMLETGARMGAGHLTVEPRGFSEAPGLDKTLSGVNDIDHRLRALPEVSRTVVRITGQAMWSTATHSLGGAFFAIDPSREDASDNVFIRSIVEGAPFESADARGIVVGRTMAEKLRVTLGKRVVFTLLDKQGEMVSEVARVSAIFDTGVPEVDGAVALLPIGMVRRMLGYGADEATMVAVFLGDHRDADGARARLIAAVGTPEREVLTWRETQPELAGVISMDRSMNYVMQILIGLLIGAGVFNTLLMSVLERRREFGVMMAIGTRPRELFGLVVLESTLVGLVGLAVGAVLTAPWYYFMRTHGIDLTGVSGMEATVNGVIVDPVLRLLLYPSSLLVICLGVLILTVTAGLYPAFQAGREPPVETLKAL